MKKFLVRMVLMLLVVLPTACSEDSKIEPVVPGDGYYVIDLSFEGVTPRYEKYNPYESIIDATQNGASFKVKCSKEHSEDMYVSCLCTSTAPEEIIYLSPYESYNSEKLKISYTFIDSLPVMEIEVTANESTEIRRIEMLIGSGYCSNSIIITQPGLSAE